MRVLSVLLTTLLLAAPVFGQQTSSENPTAAQSTTATVDQPLAHPITPAQVHEIMELTHATELERQMVRNGMATLEKVFPPYTPRDVLDDIEQRLAKIDYEPMAVVAYQKHISSEDAAKVIAFYKTPAGQRLISTMPAITQEMQTAGAKEGMRVTQQVIKAHLDEIKAAAEKYKQEHSNTPSITSPN